MTLYILPTVYAAGQLCSAVYLVKCLAADPDIRDTRCVIIGDRFSGDRLTPLEYLAWFRRKLNLKINRDAVACGRKHATDYQVKLSRDARMVNTVKGSRVRYSGRNLLDTSELKRRYPEIDNPPRDE